MHSPSFRPRPLISTCLLCEQLNAVGLKLNRLLAMIIGRIDPDHYIW